MKIRTLCRRPAAFTGILAALCAMQPLSAAIAIDPIAWGLAPGTTFRLVLVTFGTTDATSSDIASYDSFVNTQNVNQITYNGATLSWQALGLTAASSPISDSSRFSSQANSTLIYNLNGEVVSNTTAGTRFWRTSGFNQHTAAINYTINGSGNLALSANTWAWTGFDYNGQASTGRDYDSEGNQVGTVSATLGSSSPINNLVYDTEGNPSGSVASTFYPAFGRIPATANGWASLGNDAALSTQFPMYAMSSLITVTSAVPEPSTFALGSGLLVLTVAAFRDRRRRGTAE